MVVGAYDRCFCGVFVFSEIVGARGQLVFQGLFLALIFGGGFAFLGNEIGGVRRHWSGFLRFPRQKLDETYSGLPPSLTDCYHRLFIML